MLERNAGLWAPPENPEQLARAAERLANDSTLRANLAAASLAAAPLHSREQQAKDMIRALETVVS
ncbi:MAG: glycosyltransferase family 4 protein [Alphaproteobacteria bacterium]|nr:glycosyltransferase family 4 protein [Alphaproteobacteria bacterium]